MKKISVFLAILMVSMLLFVGCNNKETAETKDLEVQELVVVNWKGHGSDNPDVVNKFEEANNCKVIHEYMASEEELLTKLRTGGVGKIDVVLPNPSVLPKAINEDLLQEINPEDLTSYPDIADKFKGLPENKKDGKIYAIPWVWGATAIAYNENLIKEDLDSIDVLWDEKYKGKIAFRDDYNDDVMLAAIALGQDPNNPADLDAIKAKLLEQKPLNRTYWKTADDFTKLFANEQITLGVMWSGESAKIKLSGQPIKFFVPKEGAIGWVDYWGLVKDAPHKDLALKFIDYMIGEEYQANWANNGGPAPVNTKAIAKVDPELVEAGAMDEESLNKLHFISYHEDSVKKAWNELWQEVKAE